MEVGTLHSVAEERTEELCMICDHTQPKGIHICTKFICEECERKLVTTDTNDIHYRYYLKKLKQLKLDTLS
ncbi:carnitine--CoA ligase [Pseudalkalibacillus caeni]|uniref:Carnitine--CoA ligase n=2 Tax=Exobacillus caeni TaxID=2574798 RepID=A0A5R9F0X6_9BACL|nr:carnitine--CoA ligase [Pseudalkalibacillus caeni]